VIDQANACSLKLESRIPPDLTLRANPGLVEQALTNLLENAVRYSPEGSTVLLEALARDGTIELSIRDRGSVQAESWSGEGSVFTIRLPVSGPRAAIVIKKLLFY